MSAMNDKKIKFIDMTNNNQIGIFCTLCNFLLKTVDDAATVEKYKVCHECFLRYIESRKEDWKNGWRPPKDKIDDARIEKTRLFIE